MATRPVPMPNQRGIEVERTLPVLPTLRRWQLTEVARLVALTVAILAAVLFIGLGIENAGGPPDYQGYAIAADRLTHGESLYLDPRPGDDRLTYRHAPWLAALWIPLNALPFGSLLWQLASLAAAVYIIWSLARLGGHAGLILAALALPLLGTIPHANVGTLMLALLVWRRADPWSIGIAASLKIYPLLLVLGYVAERRWRDVLIAVSVTVTLWVPALLFGIADFVPPPAEVGLGRWVIVAAPIALVVCVWLAWRRSRWTWLALGAALPLAVPHYVGINYLWVAARRLLEEEDGERRCVLPRIHRRDRSWQR